MADVAPHSARHRAASDPSSHVWVSASAGTGKTRALTDRITRLLIDGNPPDSLLAVTFTRTAAAEMRRRILERLASWVRLDDAGLMAALAELGEADPAARLAAARGLFATVLETPGGLPIETIHGFAQSLLLAFPLEAGLAPGTAALDDRSARLLLQRALGDALAAAQQPGGQQLAADFARIAVESHERRLAELLPLLARSGDAFAALKAPEPWLRNWLGLPRDGALDALMAAALAPPAFDDGLVEAWAAAMDRLGTEAKREEAANARAWLALDPDGRAAQLQGLSCLVLTKNSEERSFSKEFAKCPPLADAVGALLPMVQALVSRQQAIALVPHGVAWIRLGASIAGHYQRLKAEAGAIDYDDMVERAARLLETPGIAPFIGWKLDRQLRHILVDEAQDTNAAQWAIADALTADFDSGEGQHGSRFRSRFVVGDFKQAIYGFQGTDPKLFQAQRGRWSQATAAGPVLLCQVDLDRNFRSGPAVLALVDEVIRTLGAAGFGLPDGSIVPAHVPHRADAAGEVRLLPPWSPATPAAAGADLPEESEEAPDAAEPAAHPHYAAMLAAMVDGWLAPGPGQLWLAARGRPARPDDILILVRARGDLMAKMVAALNGRQVPVSGVDRMDLTQPIAVRDLLSLIRFVLQPGDDLALAEFLSSPMGGLGSMDFWALRQAAPGASLWEALQRAAEPAMAAPRRLLSRALALVDRAPPHAFLSALLAEGGRAAFYARLGREAADGIDTLLAQALAFEAVAPATLQGFLRWIGDTKVEVKRDPDSAPGQVRIMTVHAAKGLQAPVVLLADATRGRRPGGGRVMIDLAGSRVPLPLIYGGKERCPAPVKALAEAARTADLEEDRRLLYVALTRAEDVLVVAGEAPRRASAAGNAPHWHAIVETALGGMPGVERSGPVAAPTLSLCHPGALPVAGAPPPAPARPPVPGWALRPAPDEPDPPRPFTPSAPAPDAAPMPPPGPGMAAAAARGRLLHRLFQHLPALAADVREAAGRRAIAAAGFAAEADRLWAEVAEVLAAPDFAPLFQPDALAEAPIAGIVGGRTVAGTVDRLLLQDGAVRIIDFKTGALVPAGAEQAHPSQLRQMAAYRAVLSAAFPGHEVQAALLFTAAPKLIHLPARLLDAHWAATTA